MRHDSGISRRDFIYGATSLAAAGVLLGGDLLAGEGPDPPVARWWTPEGEGAVRCRLCPHRCRISEGRRGVCRVRENRGGRLVTLSYGRPCALHIDPIEKKPFYHFLPGSTALSMSTVGCNLACRFCQNWQISQSSPEDSVTGWTGPGFYARTAANRGAASIAFTYGEPTVYAEYALDIAEAARDTGVKSVAVTAAYMEKGPLAAFCSTVDAVKVDLKSFDDGYYRKICGARLDPVLRNLAEIRSRGVWLEIVYLMVPSLNDDPGEISRMAAWIESELGPDVPVHFSRFRPAYRLSDLPPTPVSSLEAARESCLDAGLRYVYIGNVSGHEAGSTFCPACSRKIIERTGYRIRSFELEGGKCRFCGTPQPGVWG